MPERLVLPLRIVVRFEPDPALAKVDIAVQSPASPASSLTLTTL
jgi:hypothetical protein